MARRWAFFRGDCFLYALPLAGRVATPPTDSPLTFREVTPADLPLLEKMRSPADALWYGLLLKRGRTGVLAFHADRPVAHGWFTAEVDLEIERTYVPLAPGEIFLFDLFTSPPYRRRGFQRALVRWMLALAGERGFRRALSLVAVDNEPSVRLHESLGFEVVCRFTKARVLGLTRFYFHPNPFGPRGSLIRWM